MSRICFTLTLIAAIQLAGQTKSAPSQAQSEKGIRTAVHDLTVATFHGDIKGVRARTTDRTLGLYDLLFNILIEIPPAKEQLLKSGIRNGSDFFASSLKDAVAAQKVDAEPLAKKNADTATIVFRSATEAAVDIPAGGSWIARWEGNTWKLDSTENAKQSLLHSPMVQRLEESQRKRLQNY